MYKAGKKGYNINTFIFWAQGKRCCDICNCKESGDVLFILKTLGIENGKRIMMIEIFSDGTDQNRKKRKHKNQK